MAKAMQMFAAMLKAPLLQMESAAREILAIDNEFQQVGTKCAHVHIFAHIRTHTQISIRKRKPFFFKVPPPVQCARKLLTVCSTLLWSHTHTHALAS